MTAVDRLSCFDPRLPEDAIWLLQLTDLHLYDDPQGTLLGVNTQDAFLQVLHDAVYNNQRKPDLIVLTGDLVHDNSEAAYRRLAGALSDTGVPSYCLPGNHDHLPTMKVLTEFPGVFIKGTVNLDGWRLVLMNSQLPNREHGHLSANELKRLTQRLRTDAHVLIAMHHQPIPVGSRWIDQMKLDNASEFLKIIDNADNVRAVIWGHIHQAFASERRSVKFLASPSTCVQFTPEHEDFQVDHAPPACRMLALQQDGGITSNVLVLKQQSKNLHLGSKGY